MSSFFLIKRTLVMLDPEIRNAFTTIKVVKESWQLTTIRQFLFHFSVQISTCSFRKYQSKQVIHNFTHTDWLSKFWENLNHLKKILNFHQEVATFLISCGQYFHHCYYSYWVINFLRTDLNLVIFLFDIYLSCCRYYGDNGRIPS